VGDFMTLAEIAKASGFPARTIRYYIARGLVSGPVKSGRDAAYTSGHLERLERIKKLQAEGRTLSEVSQLLREPSDKPAVGPPTAWWQYAIAEDIVVWVKAGSNPWLTKQFRKAVDEFARAVRQPEEEGNRKPECQ
jgi:DNA-binding transcriptional MerR regulator